MRTTVGGDHFCFQEPRSGRPEALRKSRTRRSARDPLHHRSAASALDISTGFRGHGVIEIDPHRAGFGGHRIDRRDAAFAAMSDECIMQRDLFIARVQINNESGAFRCRDSCVRCLSPPVANCFDAQN